MAIDFCYLLSCFNIPYTDRLVTTTRCQCSTIRREQTE
ncbi:unnamed protein product [Paramecium octaurelia]|uniref:Uncharacterized protein n=1 Tax=Paramecium octaurelia TaxID=43137 RepID=A0A8S1TR69_PAROT|nr:unnamed protein product [Paramecium octaurelia]